MYNVIIAKLSLHRQTKRIILKDERGRLLLNSEDVVSNIWKTYISSVFGDCHKSRLSVEIGEVNKHCQKKLEKQSNAQKYAKPLDLTE